MFRKLLFTLLLGAAAALSAANPKIYLSYDKGFDSDSGDALSASNGVMLDSGLLKLKGTLHPKCGTTDPAALFPSGISGKALLIGRSEDQKHYYAVKYFPPDGISPKAGSITFWLKPMTWKGKDKNAVMFVSAEAAGQQIFIYKYWNRNELWFFYSADKTTSLAAAPIANWIENEWHYVACSWDGSELKLYIDGVLKKSVPMKKVGDRKFSHLNIGTIGWPNKVGQSLIDEVKYYDTSLTAADVEKEYGLLASRLLRTKGPVTITVGSTKPVADGVIQPYEYAFGGTGFFDAKTQTYAALQSRCFLSWDKDYFYAGVITPAGEKFKAEKTLRDSNLWEDDSVELHFIPEKSAKDKYQFIFNAKGAFYDAKNGQPAWNAEGVKTASKIVGKDWIFETAIPWSALGLKTAPAEMKFNLCRTFKEAASNTTLSPCMRAYMDPPNLTALLFSPDAPIYEIASLGDPCARKADFSLNLRTGSDTSFIAKLATQNSVLPFQFEKSVSLKKGQSGNISSGPQSLPPNTTLSVQLLANGTLLYDNSFAYADMTPVTVRYLYTNSETKEMHLICAVHQRDIRASVRLELCDKTGKTVLNQEKDIRTNMASDDVVFPIGSVPPGDYEIRIACLGPTEKVFYSNTEDIRIPGKNPPWMGCRAGLSEVVPPPWTPLKADGSVIACHGRTYQFGGQGLMSSIVSRGNELLSGDILLKVNGKTVPFTMRKNRAAPNGYEAFCELAGSAGKVRFDLTVKAEYDGCLWFTLKELPEGAEEIRSMTLEIPLLRKNLSSFDDNRGIMSKVDLRRETRTLLSNDLSAMPFFWIGGDDVGLMAGMANLKGWHVKDKSRSMELKLTPETATVVWNLVDTSMKLEKARTVEFYIQATPVKPKNKKAQTFRESDNVLVWTPFGKKYFEYLDETTFDLKRLDAIKRERESRHWRNFYYTAPHGVSPYSPDWNYFGWLWHSPLPNLGDYCVDSDISSRDRRDKVTFTYACLDCRSFFDYKLSGIAKLVANPKFGVENLYYDLSWPKSCANAAHGCAWVDDFGVPQTTFDIRGTREFNKRTYQLLKQKNPDAMFVYHLISTRTPADSFADLLVQGESYDRAVAEKESYYDVFTPDLLRIAYTARSNEQEIWLIPQFLRALQLFNPKRAAEWASDQPKMDYACRHFLGYLAVHNLNFMNGWSTRKEGHRFYKIQDELPWDEKVVFHPYWKEGPVRKVSPSTDRVMASAFSRDGKALLAVLNDTDREENVVLNVDTKALFGKTGTFQGKDGFAPADGHFVIRDGRLEMKVPPRGFRFLVF